MNAKELIQEGNVEGALVDLKNQIKSNPDDVAYRIFLFQLLCVCGAWEKALTQIKVIESLDDSALAMCKTYEQILRFESRRQSVYNGTLTPTIFGEPDPWIAKLVASLNLFSQGNTVLANKSIVEALKVAPASSGSINGESFSWIMDGDSRLGPVVEAYINGCYYWIPFDKVSNITFDAPVDLRDLVWIPAHFTWQNKGSAPGFIPVRYPSSELSEADSIRMARKTEWLEQAENSYFGLGQRMFMTDKCEYSLLDIQEIKIDSPMENT